MRIAAIKDGKYEGPFPHLRQESPRITDKNCREGFGEGNVRPYAGSSLASRRRGLCSDALINSDLRYSSHHVP